MTDKTEEQIAKEREAVASMKSAKANMTLVLERVQTLEMALSTAIYAMKRAKTYVPEEAYGPKPGAGNDYQRLRATLDQDIASAQAKLG